MHFLSFQQCKQLTSLKCLCFQALNTPHELTRPMHFFSILHTLKSLLVNIGAGSAVLGKRESSRHCHPREAAALMAGCSGPRSSGHWREHLRTPTRPGEKQGQAAAAALPPPQVPPQETDYGKRCSPFNTRWFFGGALLPHHLPLLPVPSLPGSLLEIPISICWGGGGA